MHTAVITEQALITTTTVFLYILSVCGFNAQLLYVDIKINVKVLFRGVIVCVPVTRPGQPYASSSHNNAQIH